MAAENSASQGNFNSNSLLAYKLLGDSWDENSGDNVFKKMMKDQLKYLVSGMSLVQTDPVLALQFGNDLNGGEKIAEILKTKMNELEIKNRIEPAARALLKHKYSGGALKSLEPGLKEGVGIGADNKLLLNVGSVADVDRQADGAGVDNPYAFLSDSKITTKGIKFNV